MTKGRELLERAFESMKNRTLLTENERNLEKEVSYYLLSTQESKPVAYWDTQEGKLIPAVPLSSERTCFKVPLVPLYIHPRADTADELIKALIAIGAGQGDPKAVAIQALENYMEEK